MPKGTKEEKDKRSALNSRVGRNLLAIKKRLGLKNNHEFAIAINRDPSNISKKMAGEYPISLKDIEQIMDRFSGEIALQDFFRGCPGWQSESLTRLEEAAIEQFPYIHQVVLQANRAAQTGGNDVDDLEHLLSNLDYALKSLKKIMEQTPED